MQPKSATFFKVLINRFHPGIGESFLHNLSQDEAKEITKQNIASDDPSVALTWEQDLITNTHYSWLAPIIQKLPSELQAPTAASFPEPQSSKLKAFLKIKSSQTPAPPVKNFLLDHVFHKWNPQDILPRQYLPQSPLSYLLDLSKEQLVEIIDLLAMHDLAESIRHIVDKKNLKKIYQCLTPKKQQYLRACLHQKEKIAAPKFEIEKWDGDPQKLETLLHRRGIFRFSKSLCGQSSQFMWHLTHILDIGRGTALLKYYQQDPIPNVTPYLIQQLQFVNNFLKPKSAS